NGNLVVRTDGVSWTPPLACGLLPGVLRAELLERGELRERVLHRGDLTGRRGCGASIPCGDGARCGCGRPDAGATPAEDFSRSGGHLHQRLVPGDQRDVGQLAGALSGVERGV